MERFFMQQPTFSVEIDKPQLVQGPPPVSPVSPVSVITGIYGMDAANLARLLRAKGHRVIGTHRYSAAQRVAPPGVETVCCDGTDASGIARLIAEWQPDYLFNLAAMSHVGTSFSDPIMTFNADTLAVLNILEAIRLHSGHTRMYQACHDSQTRILTPDGELSISKAAVGDLVQTINERTSQAEYKPIKKIVRYPYKGKMVRITSGSVDQLVTPNHRVLFRGENGVESAAADTLINQPLYMPQSHSNVQPACVDELISQGEASYNCDYAYQVLAKATAIGISARLEHTRFCGVSFDDHDVQNFDLYVVKQVAPELATPQYEDYDGEVWCLEVEDNHNFLIIRNGKVAYSGNSTSEQFGKNFDLVDNKPTQSISTALIPSSPYGVAKLAAHHLVRVYREGYGIYAVGGILFNHTDVTRTPTFFERKVSLFAGEWRRWREANGVNDRSDLLFYDTYIISKQTGATLQKLPLGVTDGVYRDIGWSTDYMGAALLMLEQDEPRDFVVATGEAYPINDILQFLSYNDVEWRQLVYTNPQFVRPVDVPYLRGDSSPIRELGWSPTKSFHQLIEMLMKNDGAL